MAFDQDSVFFQSEGDRWFQRNKGALEKFDPETDFPLRLMDIYAVKPRNVLEIGAANGYRVAEIQKRHKCTAVAVDASAEAVQDGKSQFPYVRFVRSYAHAIELRETFDLVIVNFVFHWIGRDRLLAAASEVDRLLADKGLLIIGDFLPDVARKTKYHHLKDQPVYTFKQDYSKLFLASGLYRPVGMLSGDMESRSATVQAGERDRMGAWLLQKISAEGYVETA